MANRTVSIYRKDWKRLDILKDNFDKKSIAEVVEMVLDEYEKKEI